MIENDKEKNNKKKKVEVIAMIDLFRVRLSFVD